MNYLQRLLEINWRQLFEIDFHQVLEIKLWHLLASMIAILLASSGITAIYCNVVHPVSATYMNYPIQEFKPKIQVTHAAPILRPPQSKKWDMVPEFNGRKY